MQGVSVAPYFTKDFFARQLPVWQDADAWNSLGEVDPRGYVPPAAFPVDTSDAAKGAMKTVQVSDEGGSSFRNFFVGLLLGVFAYLLVVNREKVINMVKALTSSKKGGQSDA